MSFKDRRSRFTEIEISDVVEGIKKDFLVKDEPELKELEKPKKEIPEWRQRIIEGRAERKAEKELQLQQKKAVKKVAAKKVVKPKPEPIKEIVIEKEKVKSTDVKLALNGTTPTANNFRALVKKQRLTVTQVLDKLLTQYIDAHELSH